MQREERLTIEKDTFEELNQEAEQLTVATNLIGKDITRPGNLKFSFYFSSGVNLKCSIRVRPVFNRENLYASKVGSLKLSGDWQFRPGEEDKQISESDIDEMKEFFKRYFVLFSMAWDEQIQENTIQDYFEGDIILDELIEDADFYNKIPKEDLEKIKTIEDFSNYCKENNLVRFYDN